MRHVRLQKRLSIKSKCNRCQSEAVKYYKRSGLLLCSCCSPKDEYFGEATLFDKSTIREINDVKRKHKNFEDELRNSVNARSVEGVEVLLLYHHPETFFAKNPFKKL